MKTAISIPDPLFRMSEQMAKRLGLSRSHFFTAAVEEFIKNRRKKNVTRILNEIYQSEPSSLDPVLSHIQAASLSRHKW